MRVSIKAAIDGYPPLSDTPMLLEVRSLSRLRLRFFPLELLLDLLFPLEGGGTAISPSGAYWDPDAG